jgi:hypothetical protein
MNADERRKRGMILDFHLRFRIWLPLAWLPRVRSDRHELVLPSLENIKLLTNLNRRVVVLLYEFRVI